MKQRNVKPLRFGVLAVAALFASGAAASASVARSNMTYEPGIDRPGSDYNNFDLSPGSDAADCMNACAADSQCRAYTYVVPGVQGANARCWLKYAIPGPVQSSCCTSGYKY